MSREISTYSLLTKDSLELKFSNDIYGLVGSDYELTPKIVPVTNGFALEIQNPVRSAVRDQKHWYSFKAVPLANFAEAEGAFDLEIEAWAKLAPSLVCRNWQDVELDHNYRMDFTRQKRPLIRFAYAEADIGIIWHYFPHTDKLAIFVGKNDKGLGGNVVFLKRGEFKIL